MVVCYTVYIATHLPTLTPHLGLERPPLLLIHMSQQCVYHPQPRMVAEGAHTNATQE